MAQTRKKLVSDLIGDLKKDITFINAPSKIPDIITFCEAPEWLGLPHHPTNPIILYPMQKIILKAFYRGSVGNEDLRLVDEEIKLCEDIGLNNDDKGDLLGKYFSGEIFSELVLVWGRRASKDFVVSLIALYEAMKLLECPGGDPYTLYELSSSNTINVLTIANAKSQAHLAFREIKEKLLHSPYFQDKYTKEGIGTSSIFLLTPKDKEENKKLSDEILRLKQEVDIKFLLKQFHNDLKKDRIIREYSDNFISSLKNDENLEIINIIQQAGRNIDAERINGIRRRVIEQKDSEDNKRLEEFKDKINRIEQEIVYEVNELEREKSKKYKFEEKQKEILIDIKEKSVGLGVDILI